jgi:hypothetical protein
MYMCSITFYLLALTLIFVLFTLRSALLSEIADDQPSRLAQPSPRPLLTDRRIFNTLLFHLYAGVHSCISVLLTKATLD